MSKKISITIPSNQGEQTFYFGRKAVLMCTTAIFSVPLLIGGSAYMHFEGKQELAMQAGDAQQLIETLIVEKEQTEFLYAEQVETNHSLSQTLTEKEGTIQLLGKRVFDVESVLGLADEELLTDDVSLEDRIDAAAVDSAVRATMFRLIPNDSPMAYQRISSSYGSRTNPISGKRHVHTGIDLTCKRGEDIVAPADGVIETVRPSKKGFGNFITMRHSFGFMSSYAHLQKFKVRSGQFVSKGDVIASCGNSGNSTGPHLHYEVRFLGRSLNPQYLMDWTPENFNYVFEKEKKVKWGPLVQLIDNVVRLQINLTNVPYISSTIDTVSSEENKKPITTN
ncbi:M23 family metallopeptidase [Vibrio splendidus]|uniref:M23 family metallopeptidase n=1 Tax=Vibrio splendidus TaxID=29497 RepID=UPI002468F063|nr:M23 family metallopeptidase [Vibrio splendidus]MDH5903912.1 M23 family metallopeptidase [Vibrio splendidus]